MLAGLRRVFLKHALNPAKGETHQQNVFFSLGSHFHSVSTSNRRSDHENTFSTESLGYSQTGRVWEECHHAYLRSHRQNPQTKHEYVLRGPTVVRFLSCICRRSAACTDDPAERSVCDRPPLYTVAAYSMSLALSHTHTRKHTPAKHTHS